MANLGTQLSPIVRRRRRVGIWVGLVVVGICILSAMVTIAVESTRYCPNWPNFPLHLFLETVGTIIAFIGFVAFVVLRARRQVRESIERESHYLRLSVEFEQILDHIPALVFYKDDQNRFLQVNRYVAESYRISKEELVGKSLYHLHAQEEAKKYHADDLQVIETGQPKLFIEESWDTQDGKRWVSTSKIPIQNEKGEIHSLVGISIDVTDRKRVEETVRQQTKILTAANAIFRGVITEQSVAELSQSFLAAAQLLTASQVGFVFELNKDGLAGVISVSDPEWHMYANPESESEGRIQGQHVASYWENVLTEGISEIKNNPTSDTDCIGWPSGQPPITASLGVPLKRGETTFGMIGLANKAGGYAHEDKEAVENLATAFVLALDRRHAEVEMRQQSAHLERLTADLSRSNEELEQFAYVASHDLQEPLRMVASYTELLAERYQGKLDEKADKYIKYAVDGATRMQGLINDLLAYSRVGTKSGIPEPVRVLDCLELALANLELALRDARGQVTHTELPVIVADQTQLVQLFQNLIGNAIKFRAEAPPQIHVAAENRSHEWLFSVADNGIGLDTQFSERIFGVFQQLHDRGKYPGSGIGLAICKKIVERHGGRIWVESELGQGTTFYFSWPMENRQDDAKGSEER
jgi:PAS domain S-box-containing protein